MAKRQIRFNPTNASSKISGRLMLEQERLAAGERRQKHVALEYFVCFAVDELDRKLPREEVEAIFADMSEIEIRLALHRLNSAIQEQNLLAAQGLTGFTLPIAKPDEPSIRPPKPGKRIKSPQAKD